MSVYMINNLYVGPSKNTCLRNLLDDQRHDQIKG
jgi:hypothetical protein